MAREPKLLLFVPIFAVIVTALFVFSESSLGETHDEFEFRTNERYYPFAKGKITEIDLNKRKVTVQTRDGLKTFFYTGGTYFFRIKEKVGADQLKKGDFVRLNFYLDSEGNEVIRRLKSEVPIEPQTQEDVSPSPQPTQEDNL